jgi:hypothetical protein
MKYALLIFSILFSFNIFSREINFLSQSSSINEVISYMNDNREEFASYYKLSDKAFEIKNYEGCVVVSDKEIIRDFQKSFKLILSKFPDEELPFNDALMDLENYLDHQSYYQCSKVGSNSNGDKVEVHYYQSLNKEIHLRIDNIAPANE